jgi:hypothetical protein
MYRRLEDKKSTIKNRIIILQLIALGSISKFYEQFKLQFYVFLLLKIEDDWKRHLVGTRIFSVLSKHCPNNFRILRHLDFFLVN